MVLELYYDLLSQPSRAVYLLLKCSGVQFKGTAVDLMKGEHLTPEFKKKNPVQKVPVINDGGFGLSESCAIMKYIAVKNKLAEHWYPKADPKKQARVEEFLNWQQFGIRKPCVDVFLETLRSKLTVGAFTQKPMDEDKVKTAKADLDKAVSNIVDHYLRDQMFIAGDKVSVADILAVCEFYQLHGVGELEPLKKSNKKFGAWIDRVIKALQPEFDKASVVVNGIREKFDAAK